MMLLNISRIGSGRDWLKRITAISIVAFEAFRLITTIFLPNFDDPKYAELAIAGLETRLRKQRLA